MFMELGGWNQGPYYQQNSPTTLRERDRKEKAPAKCQISQPELCDVIYTSPLRMTSQLKPLVKETKVRYVTYLGSPSQGLRSIHHPAPETKH